MRLEVPTAVTIKITVVWDVMLCNAVDRYQRFERICCLHLESKCKPSERI
jgi:hypothetical protein